MCTWRAGNQTPPPGWLALTVHVPVPPKLTVLPAMEHTEALAASGVFEGFRVVLTPLGEEGAANAIRVGARVLISDAYPATAELLASLGLALTPLSTDEIAKIDAGLSCMSLRWRG